MPTYMCVCVCVVVYIYISIYITSLVSVFFDDKQDFFARTTYASDECKQDTENKVSTNTTGHREQSKYEHNWTLKTKRVRTQLDTENKASMNATGH